MCGIRSALLDLLRGIIIDVQIIFWNLILYAHHSAVAHTGLGNRGYNNPHEDGSTTRDWEIAVTITPMKMAVQRTHVRCDAIYNHVSF